jgi:hypothetical protein
MTHFTGHTLLISQRSLVVLLWQIMTKTLLQIAQVLLSILLTAYVNTNISTVYIGMYVRHSTRLAYMHHSRYDELKSCAQLSSTSVAEREISLVVKELCYKPEGHGLETLILPVARSFEVHSACNRNEYRSKQK